MRRFHSPETADAGDEGGGRPRDADALLQDEIVIRVVVLREETKGRNSFGDSSH